MEGKTHIHLFPDASTTCMLNKEEHIQTATGKSKDAIEYHLRYAELSMLTSSCHFIISTKYMCAYTKKKTENALAQHLERMWRFYLRFITQKRRILQKKLHNMLADLDLFTICSWDLARLQSFGFVLFFTISRNYHCTWNSTPFIMTFDRELKSNRLIYKMYVLFRTKFTRDLVGKRTSKFNT